jgi:uncharacterized protein (DUF1800 family)
MTAQTERPTPGVQGKEREMHRTPRNGGLRAAFTAMVASLVLAACGGGDKAALQALPVASSGQVAPPAPTPKVSFYAASRFAEQVSFGATPALVAELQAKGFERWLDEQFALPARPLDMKPSEALYQLRLDDPVPRGLRQMHLRQATGEMLTAPDPLRWRVMWSLSQFIVISTAFGDPPGWVHWINLLYGHAFGNYGQLLHDVSTDRMMGVYLNNDQNRPKSAECPHCAPNENYARELMQLFSLGVIRLNLDGTPQRDARGQLMETYTQRDVEELARVLTGWVADPNPPNRPPRNWANWGRPMVPSTWPPERDAGAKRVLGRDFAAGQPADKDLRDAVDLLMSHPNAAPFVSLRLIQHLVKSDPSPAYLGRVAAVFRNNGRGMAGDMKAVLKAVLLDPEARRGDDPARSAASDGKVREPFLHTLATWRGLGCTALPAPPEFGLDLSFSPVQYPLFPASVFSFYAPTDRAPGSNLLAPEQKLLRADDLAFRMRITESLREFPGGVRDVRWIEDAGCRLDDLRQAYAAGPAAYAEFLSTRYFRGAMPAPLREHLARLMTQRVDPVVAPGDPNDGALRLLSLALVSPYFGVMK